MVLNFHSICSNVGHEWLSFSSTGLTINGSIDRINENISGITLMGKVNAMD